MLVRQATRADVFSKRCVKVEKVSLYDRFNSVFRSLDILPGRNTISRESHLNSLGPDDANGNEPTGINYAVPG